MAPLVSVVICTYNPRLDYLERVLQGLAGQTLPLQDWELLLVDNCSDRPLASLVDLTWHPQGYHCYEAQLGKNHALVHGFQRAKANLRVIVDDDNVLDPNYLEITLQISHDYPFLGAWSGQIRPAFDTPPPAWTEPYWGMLAIRSYDRDRWSNLINYYLTTPCGAGMTVRQSVTTAYLDLIRRDSRHLQMGRRGNVLNTCEDLDLAFTACDIGLGTGQFCALGLTHLIPPHRLEEAYLLRLQEGMAYGTLMLEFLRNPDLPIPNPSWAGRWLQRIRLWRMDARSRRFYQSAQRGCQRAYDEIHQWRSQVRQ